MSRTCDFCGKRPGVGNSVSHANNKTKKRNFPNLQSIRINDKGTVRRVSLCTRCIRTADFQKVV